MIGPGSDKDQTDRITKGGISIFLTTKRKLLATIIWMTATRGAINVMPASKSQLQKVVLPPLRRASQRKGLPPGPPGPPRPIKAYQAPGRHKAHRAHCPTRCSRPTTLGRQAACPTGPRAGSRPSQPIVMWKAWAWAQLFNSHTSLESTSLSSDNHTVGMHKWLVIDTYISKKSEF